MDFMYYILGTNNTKILPKMELINLSLSMNQINYELLMHHWEEKTQTEH